MLTGRNRHTTLILSAILLSLFVQLGVTKFSIVQPLEQIQDSTTKIESTINAAGLSPQFEGMIRGRYHERAKSKFGND